MKKGLIKRDSVGDIPKTTVLVLVFLAVMISVLGTWTVLTTIDDVLSIPQPNVVYQESTAPTAGVLSLIVEEKGDGSNG